MPAVSILIPAYKPEFLRQAIVSAQEQTCRDIEILVGDDTADGKLRPIVETLAQSDPRVRYFHHGFGNGYRNTAVLWEKAQARYVKWLFDDDVLLPASAESLMLALQAHPGSVMAFHERVFIDGEGHITKMPKPLLEAGVCALLDRKFLASNMLPTLLNLIGEPSNVMLDRKLFGALDRAYDYQTYSLIFLSDMAMFLNCADRAPIVLVGGFLSGFRQHAGQASATDSPIYGAGNFEWELLVRGEVSLGNLDKRMLPAIVPRLKTMYSAHCRNFPELVPLLEGLDELNAMPDDPLNSPTYIANLESARAMTWERFYARRGDTQVANTCFVCSKQVGAWLPHPQLKASKRLDFLIELESVGSTLEKHICPSCHCNDRDRHLWLYMSRVGLVERIPGCRVLHIAPEGRLEPLIRSLKPSEYIVGDLFPKQEGHLKINIEKLEFRDEQFDLIVCNHVLEHVDDPEAALRELSRCLSPNGRLIAQTPYSRVLKRTVEATKSLSIAFKTRYYGQDDHVRLFGADIVDYFRAAGLHGALYSHNELLPDIDPDRYGVNGQEPFFLFSKDEGPLLQK